MSEPDKNQSIALLEEFIQSESLRQHCHMVATAMDGYAGLLNLTEDEKHVWWTAGLLHDLDWEKHPDEHPLIAVREILPNRGYSQSIINAVESHAPERTGKEPKTNLERYLFACDELSGFMNAVSLMRPNGFSDMKVKSVTKKLKDRRFAENVPRSDITKGAELISLPLRDHIQNLINILKKEY